MSIHVIQTPVGPLDPLSDLEFVVLAFSLDLEFHIVSVLRRQHFHLIQVW